MDPVTHGLVGIVLSTLSGHTIQPNNPVILGCVLGAMLPDLDIVTHFKGRLNYLLKHRGASHSLVSLSAMALGLSTVLYLIFPTTSWMTIFVWTLIGTMSHGILDILNSYGVQLLWPFSHKKISADMIMLTDPVVLSSMLVSPIITLKFPEYATISALVALLFSGIYLGLRHLGRLKNRDQLIKLYNLNDRNQAKVLPAMYRPFTWNFILFQEDNVSFGIIRSKKPSICRVLPKFDGKNPSTSNALEGTIAEIFNQFTPYYHVIDHSCDENCNVEFLDLRYWFKGDFIYTGYVFLNEDGEISQEIFHSLPNKKNVLVSC